MVRRFRKCLMLMKTVGSVAMIAMSQRAAFIMSVVTWRSARGAARSFSVAIVWTTMMTNPRHRILETWLTHGPFS
jgi:hypothetical protein